MPATEVRVNAQGQTLVLTSCKDLSGAATTLFTTYTASTDAFSGTVTFPLTVVGDTSFFLNSGAGGIAPVILGVSTAGGLALNGGFGTDTGYRVWRQPGSRVDIYPLANSLQDLIASSGPYLANESIAPADAVADLAALTTQIATATAVFLRAGTLVSNLGFIVGGTAAGTPTNTFVALYSTAATPALLGQSADQLTLALTLNTAFSFALATPVQITQSGFYYVSVMSKATTVPTLRGANLGNAVVAGARGLRPVAALTHGSALTGTAPATIAAPTTVATVPYVFVT